MPLDVHQREAEVGSREMDPETRVATVESFIEPLGAIVHQAGKLRLQPLSRGETSLPLEFLSGHDLPQVVRAGEFSMATDAGEGQQSVFGFRTQKVWLLVDDVNLTCLQTPAEVITVL